VPKTFLGGIYQANGDGSHQDASNGSRERNVWSNNKLDIEIGGLTSTADNLYEPSSAH